MQNKRVGLADPKFGRMKEDTKTTTEELRLVGSIPDSLSRAINELCWFHQQGSLFQHGTKEDKIAEGKWFLEKFNIFKVAEKL